MVAISTLSKIGSLAVAIALSSEALAQPIDTRDVPSDLAARDTDMVSELNVREDQVLQSRNYHCPQCGNYWATTKELNGHGCGRVTPMEVPHPSKSSKSSKSRKHRSLDDELEARDSDIAELDSRDETQVLQSRNYHCPQCGNYWATTKELNGHGCGRVTPMEVPHPSKSSKSSKSRKHRSLDELEARDSDIAELDSRDETQVLQSRNYHCPQCGNYWATTKELNGHGCGRVTPMEVPHPSKSSKSSKSRKHRSLEARHPFDLIPGAERRDEAQVLQSRNYHCPQCGNYWATTKELNGHGCGRVTPMEVPHPSSKSRKGRK